MVGTVRLTQDRQEGTSESLPANNLLGIGLRGDCGDNITGLIVLKCDSDVCLSSAQDEFNQPKALEPKGYLIS